MSDHERGNHGVAPEILTHKPSLQSLVDSAMIESDMVDDIGTRDGVLTNGNA